MFYIWFIFNIILYLLTFPLKLLITLIAYPMWKNFHVFDEQLFEKNNDKLKIDLKPTGDSAKFEGMLSVITQDKNLIMKYIHEDNFTRLYNNKNFSGDMTSGWLYGFVNLYLNNKLSHDDLIKFKKAVENSIFKKPYFTYKSKNVKEYDRGFLFRWWFMGFDFIVPLSLLYVYNYLFPNNTLRLIYVILYILSFPLLYLYPVPSILAKRLYWISWYSIHSRTLLARTTLLLGKNKLMERILRFSYSRYGRINPEITALYCDYYGWNNSDKNFVKIWLDDYTNKKEKMENIPFYEFYNLKNLLKRKGNKKIKISKYLLPSRYRHNEYPWEKPLDRPSYNHDPNIAYYHLRYLYEKT